MLVKHGLLALLSLGPAYGSQLHAELQERTRRSPAVNPGQVYSTLERAREAGLVVQEGRTADGLTLYGLTASGRAEAHRWLSEPENGYDDMVGQVMLALSLPGADARPLIAEHRARWQAAAAMAEDAAHDDEGLAASLRRRARHALARAALAWLDDAEQEAGTGRAARQLAGSRPSRGRPRTITAADDPADSPGSAASAAEVPSAASAAAAVSPAAALASIAPLSRQADGTLG